MFEMNEANMSVLIEGKEIELTKREFCMIHLLSSNPKTAFSYEEIYQSVWNEAYNNQKYKVANVIFRLREKIEKNTEKPIYIRTVRSRGYMLDV
ncbi:winged helix-turn-helix domain-containing protein [Enterococcus rivorum]